MSNSYLETSTTQTSITAYVAGLATFSNYSEIYITINGQKSVNLARGGSGHSTSKAFTANNLSVGTDYLCRWSLRTSSSSYDGSVYVSTSSPPRPPTVGSIPSASVSNHSKGAIEVSWGSATNATAYRIEVYNYYSSSLITSTSTSSTSTVISGLPQSTYLEVKLYGSRYDDGWGWNNGSPVYRYITTTDYSVGGVGTVSVSASTTSGALDVSWSYANNASSYAVEVWDSSGTQWLGYRYTTTNRTYKITGLSENTSYQIKVYATNGSENGTPSYGSGRTSSYPPSSITGLSAWAGTASGGIHASWNTATNVTNYRWEIYRGTSATSAYYVTGGYTTSTSIAYTGLAEYTTYTVKVYGTRSGYENGGFQTAQVLTKDLTSPTVSITTSDGKGRMYIAYSASDSHSGLRSIDTFYTQISNANGTSYSRGSYTTNKYKTFTEDAYGNELQHDAQYYMKVVAYDTEGNSSSANVRVQFKLARPTNWAWHTVKVAGQAVALTASEWNSLCTKINQFRQYKGLSNYTFTTATKGNVITATIVNQAITAINAMNPPSKPPNSAVAKQTTISASFLNTLSASLNSIQ